MRGAQIQGPFECFPQMAEHVLLGVVAFSDKFLRGVLPEVVKTLLHRTDFFYTLYVTENFTKYWKVEY